MQKMLIVGCGLSGICLSHHLIAREIQVTILDNGVNNSSRIAAGMINPLVFRRMTKSWRVDEFLPYAKEYYNTLEQRLNQQFFHPIVIRRFFSSLQERQFWEERQHQPEFKNYMFELTEQDNKVHEYANEFGSGRVNNAAHIDAELFLEKSKKELKNLVDYRNFELDYSEIDPDLGTFSGESFDLIIFAEGYLGIDNPWFKHLPLTQTKGETLTIKLGELVTNESLNRKCFLLPLDSTTFKIGSNYNWDDPTTHPTEEAKRDILHHLTFLTPEIPVVLEHHAGVRPTTKDRRPFIGVHADFPRLAIFNGLGAKGYLIAPLLAKEFVDFLFDGTTLDRECDIEGR